MLHLAPSLIQRTRTFVSKFLYHFGIHCATHQIRILLVSCVVITSLFYPALATYSSSQPQSLTASTFRILDAFLAANPASGLEAHRDLHNLWTGHSSIHVLEDGARSRCGLDRTLRAEKILIQSPLIEDAGTLNQNILLSTLRLERHISDILDSHHIPCLRGSNGHCFVLSPLAFWQYDEQALLADGNVLDTLGLYKNVSVDGIPITPHMVLAGRGVNEDNAANFDSAMFLALTYFFPTKDCLGNAAHTAWLKTVEKAIDQSADVLFETQAPELLTLRYDVNSPGRKAFSAITTFFYVAYIAFFAYVSWAMRRMRAIHSRIGLVFTALVEIAVSTVTSLSVCALVGFKVTMVPWELLPAVIIFVGAENMFALVDAVSTTAVTLPVKLRIAEGLSRAGTSNTLKVLSSNIFLGVIGFFSVGVIRQFCFFAIVVLVAHWFLAHTFFMAVLSIDLQRLELDELLTQNAALAPAVATSPRKETPVQSHSTWKKIAIMGQNLLRGRATKNISLILLLAITATLYYTTYSVAAHDKDSLAAASPRGALFRPKAPSAELEEHATPTWHIWNLFNPDEDRYVHLRIEKPTIVIFRPEDPGNEHRPKRKVHRPRATLRSFRTLLTVLKIVVLPITATTVGLWGILLYLLKDTELLEAQRNKADVDVPDVVEKAPLDERVSFTTLPRAFSTDVDLLAASKDGQIVAAVGLQNELVIWRLDRQSHSHIAIDTTDVLLRAASTSDARPDITAVAVDVSGQLCAVGTGAGIIAVWAISEKSARALPHLYSERSASRVVDLQFLASSHMNPTSAIPTLISTYEQGAAIQWTIGNMPTSNQILPSRPGSVKKCTLCRPDRSERLLVAFSMNDGNVELVDLTTGQLPSVLPDCCIPAGNPKDLVVRVEGSYVDVGEERRLVIATATEAGAVSLWDAGTGECISVLDDIYGAIGSLHISPVPRERCRYCGENLPEGFSVSFSVAHAVLFYNVLTPSPEARQCSCAHNQPRKPASWDFVPGRRSRSGSAASSVGSAAPSTARKSSAVSSTLDNISAFPVSGHGVHSRRASEKDAMRRASDNNLSVALVADERESDHPVGPAVDGASVAASARWQDTSASRVADTTCERGSWGVCGTGVVGVRRKPRSSARVVGAATQGLTPSVLDRWEVWMFDPATARVQASPLGALHDEYPAARAAQSRIPRLPFTRVLPLLGGGSYGLAGFGNTVGLFSFASP
ncbi:hypothetical protein PLICRDRAFT_109217 [Plicaturopsis crispa FD-325 SS-3]|nr:hypothetical protein PLICRDRAFT_109217 [Plicaturopsis crispa FD-325 SS-3]